MIDNIPYGTVTLLFTDIQGSTSLFQDHPEAMQHALLRHHAILRDAIAAHNGYVFQIVGDAFHTAFAAAADAVAAAQDAQRALAAEPWGETGALRVRMGLHSGVVQVHAEDTTAGQYSGYEAMAHAQRVMALAYGGQVLLSTAARELARSRLPDDVSLRDLGEYELKGIPQPEHLWQMVAIDLPAEFPPLPSRSSRPNNLPTQLSSFIGREKDIAEAKELLAQHRLVTLTGSGGVGKTRLAIAVGYALLPLYTNGVWLVELAAYSDPALVPQAVAAAFGLHEEPGRPLLAVLTDYLREKSLLLILDNCEHVIDASAQLAQHLLRHCPTLRILASSREALGVEGEVSVRVQSLTLPPLEQVTPEKLAASEAVRLFVERAAAVAPGFALSDANAPAIAQICCRLDGIPLAIELAASRARMLSGEQIAARLDDAFRLLTGGSRTAVPRQQTLRALIDWSYNLLSQHERVLLRRLSVFMGGWTLEAAEAVCSGDGIDAVDVLDVLGQLVDKSLVVADLGQGGETRYHLLETIRQYAREKLVDAGEGEQTRQRHLQYYCHLAEEAEPKLHGPEAVALMDMLEEEHNNSRAALEWSLAGQAELGLRLADGLMWFWSIRGYAIEGWRWFEKLLRLATGVPASLRATALGAAGWLAKLVENDASAQVSSEESLALHRQAGDKAGAAFALATLAAVAFWRRDYPRDYPRAVTLGQESAALFREAGVTWGVRHAQAGLGTIAQMRGDDEQAESCYRESLRLAREIGEEDGIAFALLCLGDLALKREQCEHAVALFQEAWAITQRVKSRIATINILRKMAVAATCLGRLEQARIWSEQAVAISRDYGVRWGVRAALMALGYVAQAQGDNKRAAAAYGESLSLSNEMHDKEGLAMSLAGLSDAAAALGQPERAAKLAAAADTFCTDWRAGAFTQRVAGHNRQLAVVRATLGEQAFHAAWQAGQALTTEQVLAEANDLLEK